MLIYAAWRVVSALLPGSTDAKGWAHRIGYIASAVMYITFAISAIALARHAPRTPNGNKKVTDISAVDHDAHGVGRVVIGLVGVIVIAVGLYRISKGVKMDVDDELDMSGMSPTRGRWTERLGADRRGRPRHRLRAGRILPGCERRFATTPTRPPASMAHCAASLLESWGVVVVVVVGIGFAAYGIFCLATFTRRRLQAP